MSTRSTIYTTPDEWRPRMTLSDDWADGMIYLTILADGLDVEIILPAALVKAIRESDACGRYAQTGNTSGDKT